MTKDEACKILVEYDLQYLSYILPSGVSLSECVEAGIEAAYGLQLDTIGTKYFGLNRTAHGSFPEPDDAFRHRILSYIPADLGLNSVTSVNGFTGESMLDMYNKNQCSHKWAFYESLISTDQNFHYCVNCDAKKKEIA